MSETLQIGTKVVFTGFSDPENPPDNGEALVVDEVYAIVAVNEGEKGAEPSYDVEAPNPSFDKKKRKSASNPETVRVDLFSDEFEVEGEGEEAEGIGGVEVALADVKVGDHVSVEDTTGEVLTGEVHKKTRGGLVLVIESDDGEEEVTYKAAEIKLIVMAGEETEPEKAPEPVKAPAKATRGKAAAKAETPAKAKTTAKAGAKATTKTTAKAGAKAAAKTGAKGKTKAAAPPKEEVDEDLRGMLVLQADEENEDILGLVEENGDADTLCALASEMAEESVNQEYRLGGILYHVRLSKSFRQIEDGKFDKVGGFAEFVETELKTSYRKAMNLIDIYTGMCRFKIEPEVLPRVGWAKMVDIVRVMDEKNADKLIELAEEQTAVDLRETIKESYAKKGADQREVVKRVTFKFRLIEEQGVLIQGYLEQAAQKLGHKKLEQTFEHIVSEWAQEHLDVSKVRKVGATSSKTATAGKTAAATGRGARRTVAAAA